MPLFRKVLHLLFWICFGAYLAAAGVLLGTRYWVLPNIDQWRPNIEAYAHKTLGLNVKIGEIKADWSGLNPSLQVSALRVQSQQGETVLELPSVTAVMAWRSVFVMSPRFLSLRADGLDIDIRRDTADHLWIAGQSVSLDGTSTDEQGAERVLRWLADQRDLAIVGATVRWHDEWTQTPEILLRDVNARVSNGLTSHRFTLSAKPPLSVAHGLRLTGTFHRNPLAWGTSGWTGEVYANLQDADVQAWRSWLSLPDLSGHVDGRAWLTWDNGTLTDMSADMAVRDVRWQEVSDSHASAVASLAEPEADDLEVLSGLIHVQGAPGDVLHSQDLSLGTSRDHAGLKVSATLTGVRATLADMFDPAKLALDTIELDARVLRRVSQPLTVNVHSLVLNNQDAEIHLNGQWLAQGKTEAGSGDFQGAIVRGSMPALYKYLPTTVNADARDWLKHGLPAGQITGATFLVQGDLDEFPFEDPTDRGQFRVGGAFQNAMVDAAPASAGDKGWPRLENVSGNFVVDKVSLSLDSVQGAIAHTGPNHVLHMDQVVATIPDMENASTLHLNTFITGTVPAFLALSANYQLGQLLDGLLDEAEGTGQWQVPLTLEVPLLTPEDAKVQGKVKFSGNNFRFIPEMPMLQKIQGELSFSEQGVRIKDLRGTFLGGAARVAGKLEQSSDALIVNGVVSAAAIARWTNEPLLKNLSGNASYRGRIGTGPGGVLDIGVDSDLVGLTSNFPGLLKKASATPMPLKAHWGAPNAASSGKRDQLSVTLGTDLSLLLEHDRSARGSYFTRGALGVDRDVSLPSAAGMLVDVRVPLLDVDAWQDTLDQAEQDASTTKTAAGATTTPDLWPPLTTVNIRAGTLRVGGVNLDNLTLSATRPTPSQWHVDLESRQAGGSIAWQDVSGDIKGKVRARFSHLDLGTESEVATSLPVNQAPTPDKDLSHIPALDLRVEKFSLYGRHFGTLNIQGTALNQGKVWKLDSLQLGNKAGLLDATGTWTLTGLQRGLTVDATARFNDLGAFMDGLGYPGKLSGGQGTIAGRITWRDLPWTHDLNNIDGTLQTSLDDGRFLSVESRSARLLELLSLQSLQRIASLDANPAQAWRDGFPFDTIRGDVTLRQGVAHTEGYKLNGAVATIVLAGDTDIVSEHWNMRAVVVPNVDVSGAAVLTALAVNPVIGIGAFLTQWLFKQPLARAMTMEYGVNGTWDEPKIEPIVPTSVRSSTPIEEYIQH